MTVNVPFGEACDADEVEVETWIRSPDLLVIDVSWRELGDCSQDYSPTTRPVEFRPDPGLRWILQCIDDDCPIVSEDLVIEQMP